MNTIEAILSSLDTVQEIGKIIKLRKIGSNYHGLCCFHNEKTPSFMVYEQQGKFHCFGCGEGGSIIDFIRLYKGYPDDKVGRAAAINDCAAMAGITVAPFDSKMVLRKGKDDEFHTIETKESLLRFDPPGIIPRAFMQWTESKGIDPMVAMGLHYSGDIKFIDGTPCFVYSNGVKIRPEYESSKSMRWIDGGAAESIWRFEELTHIRKRLTIVCEGESDTMMMLSCLAWACAQPGVTIRPWEIAVVGAPQASWRPSPAICGLLSLGRRTLLVFDNDFAGVTAETEISDIMTASAISKWAPRPMTWPWVLSPGVNDLCALGRKKVAKTLASCLGII